MFDKLNDDCWLHILKYVPLRDQLALAQVSKRLHCNVQNHWHGLKEAQCDTGVLKYFEQHPNEMHEFLQLASGSLQKLTLKLPNITTLIESWKSYNFTKLVYLDCYTKNSDAETLLLTELFPHLTHVTLLSRTSGRHIWNWTQLRELNLICSGSLDTSIFHQIFSSLLLRKAKLRLYRFNEIRSILPIFMCNTLEELVIDDHHLLDALLLKLLQLPRFRRATILHLLHYCNGLVQTVANFRPQNVKSLLFNEAFWNSSRLSDFIIRMSNLRRLALQDDAIDTKELYKICARLPDLEELHLIKMRALPTPTQLWDIVAACETLKVLNLSSSRLDEQFVDMSASCLERVFKNRNANSALTLHVHNTILERSRQKVVAELRHPNLKISFEAVDLNMWSPRCVEIELESTSNL